MAEDVNEVLGVAEATPVQQENNSAEIAPVQQPKKEDNDAENMLERLAGIVFIAGIIAAIICLFTMVWVRDPSYTYLDKKMFNPSGLVITVSVLLSALISSSIMQVLAKISLTLKDINKKLK